VVGREATPPWQSAQQRPQYPGEAVVEPDTPPGEQRTAVEASMVLRDMAGKRQVKGSRA